MCDSEASFEVLLSYSLYKSVGLMTVMCHRLLFKSLLFKNEKKQTNIR